MTIQKIVQQAEALSIADQIHLVSQLIQIVDRNMQANADNTLSVTDSQTEETSATNTSAVGIIAELIKKPISFEGEPLIRQEIYDR
ncbi:MAG: hypothetical protein QNJ46_17325 [Leptolyngbyaceae cyanobacterium MO_188.B28]|nr:hypothetical protein [Leptolyngbyaceae cyanobacterium MO_188.B28]